MMSKNSSHQPQDNFKSSTDVVSTLLTIVWHLSMFLPAKMRSVIHTIIQGLRMAMVLKDTEETTAS